MPQTCSGLCMLHTIVQATAAVAGQSNLALPHLEGIYAVPCPQAQPRLATNVVGCRAAEQNSGVTLSVQLMSVKLGHADRLLTADLLQPTPLLQPALQLQAAPQPFHRSPYTQPSLSATHSSWAGSSTSRQAVVRPFSVAATCGT